MRPLIAFKYLDLIPITQAEFEGMPVIIEGELLGSVADFERLPLDDENHHEYFRRQFLYVYGQTLEPDHRKLQGIVESVRLLNESGIQPIVYVTPIDHQSAERYAGTELLERVENNIDVIRGVLDAEGVELLDWSSDLNPKAFCYTYAVHEHLGQQARYTVAERLAELIENKRAPNSN